MTVPETLNWFAPGSKTIVFVALSTTAKVSTAVAPPDSVPLSEPPSANVNVLLSVAAPVTFSKLRERDAADRAGVGAGDRRSGAAVAGAGERVGAGAADEVVDLVERGHAGRGGGGQVDEHRGRERREVERVVARVLDVGVEAAVDRADRARGREREGVVEVAADELLDGVEAERR